MTPDAPTPIVRRRFAAMTVSVLIALTVTFGIQWLTKPRPNYVTQVPSPATMAYPITPTFTDPYWDRWLIAIRTATARIDKSGIIDGESLTAPEDLTRQQLQSGEYRQVRIYNVFDHKTRNWAAQWCVNTGPSRFMFLRDHRMVRIACREGTPLYGFYFFDFESMTSSENACQLWPQDDAARSQETKRSDDMLTITIASASADHPLQFQSLDDYQRQSAKRTQCSARSEWHVVRDLKSRWLFPHC